MANVKELNINNTNYDIIGKGVVNQNTSETNPLKYWTGTTEEYEALENIDADTVYVIKDNYTPANVETLFDFKFCDHIIDNICWVNADNYDWVDGTRYTSAYQHLVDDFTDAQAEQGQLDIENDTIVPSYSETIGSYTIYYYLAHDEHKIILPDQATTAENIYAESGISWYYLLDTGNSRFKLPRTKHGFVGYRTEPGEYVPAGLPNITGTSGWIKIYGTGATGAFLKSTTSSQAYTGTSSQASTSGNIVLDASDSNPIYGNSDTVQPPATQMLLYFYVGNQVINQDMIDVSAINTELSNKADKDLSNVDSKIDYVVETQAPTAENNYTWYRLYKSGWVEQGGKMATAGTNTTVQLLKEMDNTTYHCLISMDAPTNPASAYSIWYTYDQHSTYFKYYMSGGSSTYPFFWEVKGFAAQS